jgi:hypothetical protein
MTKLPHQTVFLWTVLTVVLTFEAARGTKASTTLDVVFADYRSGRFAAVSAAFDDDRTFAAEVERGVKAFANSHAADPSVASFLLEYSEASYRRGRQAAESIFGAAIVIRSRGPRGTDTDRAWNSAALALVEARGAGLDLGTAREVARSSRELHVFPGDRRTPESDLNRLADRLSPAEVALAKGVLKEQVALNGRNMLRTFQNVGAATQETISGAQSRYDRSADRIKQMNFAEEKRRIAVAIDAFVEAERFIEVRLEARLRRAVLLQFVAENQAALGGSGYAESDSLLAGIIREAAGVRLAYLAHYFAGRSLLLRGELKKAQAQFDSATDLAPEFASAKLAAAGTRFLQGDPPMGDFLRSVAADTGSGDPVRTYRYGTYALWNSLVDALRSTLPIQQ